MLKILGGVSAALLLASPLAAGVTFDPTTGTGFVGKGDVQSAFGWNNAQLQANAAGIGFVYDETVTYNAVCGWGTAESGGVPTRFTRFRNRRAVVISSLSYSPRIHQQIDGFFLQGFGAEQGDGDVPNVGDQCTVPADGGTVRIGVWTEVTEISRTGGFFVTFGGVSKPLF